MKHPESAAMIERHLFKPAIWVIKIGGKLAEDPVLRTRFAAACGRLPVQLVIVHGGGALVTQLQTSMGMTPRFEAGRRITSTHEMRVVEMVLSGSLNKDMVRALQTAGLAAIGLSGVDGDMVRCTLVPRLGAVGVPAVVKAEVLQVLLTAGLVPVVSPVSLGPADGQTGQTSAVNVNADEFACALAQALNAERLLLMSDVQGVHVAGSHRDLIDTDEVEDLIAAGEISGGMIPKARSARAAVLSGVGEVLICGFGDDLAALGGTALVHGDKRVRHVG